MNVLGLLTEALRSPVVRSFVEQMSAAKSEAPAKTDDKKVDKKDAEDQKKVQLLLPLELG